MTIILQDIKEALGVDEGNLGFDKELLLLINATRVSLVEKGLAEFESVTFTEESVWPDFRNPEIGDVVKGFIILKMRQLFDMTASMAVAETLSNALDVMEGQVMHEIEHEEVV